jgi:hypothetical protein
LGFAKTVSLNKRNTIKAGAVRRHEAQRQHQTNDADEHSERGSAAYDST